MTPTQEDIRLAQVITNMRSASALEPDGDFGKFTRAAIEAYLPWWSQGFTGPPEWHRQIAAVIQNEAIRRNVSTGRYDAWFGRLTSAASAKLQKLLLPRIFTADPGPQIVTSELTDLPPPENLRPGEEVRVWDAGLVFRTRSKLIRPTHLVIHHTANPNKAWGVRECHAYHNSIGWNGMGYNYFIDASNYQVYLGRSTHLTEYTGAHVAGWNSRSIGVCLSGHYSKEAPDARALEVTAQFSAQLMLKHRIPIEHLKQHSELASKDCPGKLFPWRQFVSRVNQLLK